MASIASEPIYFSRVRQAGRPVVEDLPKFDLDAYIANYKGMISLWFVNLFGLLALA